MKAFVAGLVTIAAIITFCTKTPGRPIACDNTVICVWSLDTQEVWYKW